MSKTIPVEQFNLQNVEKLKKAAERVLDVARQYGATQTELGLSLHYGFSVSAREGAVEKVEYHHDKSVNVTVYFGQRSGSASFSDLRDKAISDAVEAACHIAKYTNEDPCAGLPDKEDLAFNYPEINMFYPWNISVEEAIQLACDCEQEAKSLDKRIVSAEDVSLSTSSAFSIYANSHGFLGYIPVSNHQLSCTLIARVDQDMQRDVGYTLSPDPNDLYSISQVAEEAVTRTVSRLNARRLSTRTAPVIFLSEEARSLFSHFASAISGGNIYRKSSFLLNHLDQQIFPEWLTLYEQPHLLKGLGSTPFDDDGILTRHNHFIEKGRLQHYALSVYSARQLNLKTTANAGGVHNLTVTHQNVTLNDLMRQMHKGLIVQEVMGQGVNIITGDYSRGVTGFWVENGEIQYSVHEITIAGNLKDMFKNIIAIGNDIDHRGNILTGSVLIEQMTIAGA